MWLKIFVILKVRREGRGLFKTIKCFVINYFIKRANFMLMEIQKIIKKNELCRTYFYTLCFYVFCVINFKTCFLKKNRYNIIFIYLRLFWKLFGKWSILWSQNIWRLFYVWLKVVYKHFRGFKVVILTQKFRKTEFIDKVICINLHLFTRWFESQT